MTNISIGSIMVQKNACSKRNSQRHPHLREFVSSVANYNPGILDPLSGSTDRKIFYFNFYFSLALRYSNLQVSGGVRIDVLSAGSTEFHSIAYHVTMHAIGCLQL
jgi:hypothetical protein